VGDDLFGVAAEQARQLAAPLADRLRPTALAEIVGQRHLIGDGRPLRRWVRSGGRGSLLLWGPPGTGKTTIARVLVRSVGAMFEQLSAVSASVSDIRRVAEQATRRLGEQGTSSVLFLDEIHRFTRSQQDALLPHVESGLITLIGATTESPWATVNRPLLSRCTVHRLEPLDVEELAVLADRGAAQLQRSLDDDARDLLVACVDGDGRRLLVALEAAALGAEPGSVDVLPAEATSVEAISIEAVRVGLGAGAHHYGRGDHYDAASAFIKHMRASNADQALAWMLHMLDGGEDPRFIARRLLIFASEDVGVADRSALLIAEAASRAVEFVGLPECRYHLADATLVLAAAAKSRGVGDAMADAALLELLAPPGQ